MVDKVEKIWLDGKLVNWDEANVHLLTHTLHYGLGVFEGIRCYKLHDGRSAIFRLDEHLERLFHSAQIVQLPIPWSQEDIKQACLSLVRTNRLEECYLRPLAFVGEGAMGLGAKNPTRFSIIAWKWGAYLGEDGLQRGIRAKVSSFQRVGVNSLMAKGKVVGHYVNSILAKREVVSAGYDEAIMLDPQGYVSEASGENIFMVRKGSVYTPPDGASILRGITRDAIMTLLAEMNIPVHEKLISRDELYIADEVFLCGTAAEVTPVREIDDRSIGSGSRGAITKRVQERFFQIVRDVENTQPQWLSVVA